MCSPTPLPRCSRGRSPIPSPPRWSPSRRRVSSGGWRSACRTGSAPRAATASAQACPSLPLARWWPSRSVGRSAVHPTRTRGTPSVRYGRCWRCSTPPPTSRGAPHCRPTATAATSLARRLAELFGTYATHRPELLRSWRMGGVGRCRRRPGLAARAVATAARADRRPGSHRAGRRGVRRLARRSRRSPPCPSACRCSGPPGWPHRSSRSSRRWVSTGRCTCGSPIRRPGSGPRLAPCGVPPRAADPTRRRRGPPPAVLARTRCPRAADAAHGRRARPARPPTTRAPSRHPPCWAGCSASCATTVRPRRPVRAHRHLRAGALLPRAGPSGRGAARGRARPAGSRSHARAARRPRHVPRHRDVRAADLRGVRAGRRRHPARRCRCGWPTGRCGRSTRCSTSWPGCWSSPRPGSPRPRCSTCSRPPPCAGASRSTTAISTGCASSPSAPVCAGVSTPRTGGRSSWKRSARTRGRQGSTGCCWASRCRRDALAGHRAARRGRAGRHRPHRTAGRVRRAARGRARAAVRRAAAAGVDGHARHGRSSCSRPPPPPTAWQAAQARAELAEATHVAGPHAATVPLGLADVRSLLAERLRGRPPARASAPARSPWPRWCRCARCRTASSACSGWTTACSPAQARSTATTCWPARPARRRARRRAAKTASSCSTRSWRPPTRSSSSTPGADERTGLRRPPAVPLGELLDARRRHRAGGRSSWSGIRCSRSTRATSPRLHRSASTAAELAGARAAAGPRAAPPPFLPAPLPRRARPVSSTTWSRSRAPGKGFLTQRVGCRCSRGTRRPPTRCRSRRMASPRGRSGTGCWATGSRAATCDRCRQAEWRRGELPPGALGDRLLATCWRTSSPWWTAAAEYRVGEPADRDVDVELPDGPASSARWAACTGTTALRVDTPGSPRSSGSGRGPGWWRSPRPPASRGRRSRSGGASGSASPAPRSDRCARTRPAPCSPSWWRCGRRAVRAAAAVRRHRAHVRAGPPGRRERGRRAGRGRAGVDERRRAPSAPTPHTNGSGVGPHPRRCCPATRAAGRRAHPVRRARPRALEPLLQMEDMVRR